MSADKKDLEREFDLLMARAGAVVPQDRRAGTIACYEDLKRMCALLRRPRSAASEPSNIYSLDAVLRGR